MKVKKLKIKFFWISLAILIALVFLFDFFQNRKREISSNQKNIAINDNQLFSKMTTTTSSVADFLQEQSLNLTDFDLIFPSPQTKLTNGMTILIKRAKKIIITVDGRKITTHTFENYVVPAVLGASISLDQDDILSVHRNDFVYNNMNIEITRVTKKIETIQKKISFKTIIKEDKKLSWQKKQIKQKGISGLKEMTYEIVYHNNKEINRHKIKTEIIEEPVDEIIKQGTYVELGKKHTGQASWYAYTGTMAAASPWLPFGSYVKVTNTANGKSVIVKINDKGPFVGGRIIDLDKVAFQEIASIGVGVINIKMEEIKN